MTQAPLVKRSVLCSFLLNEPFYDKNTATGYIRTQLYETSPQRPSIRLDIDSASSNMAAISNSSIGKPFYGRSFIDCYLETVTILFLLCCRRCVKRALYKNNHSLERWSVRDIALKVKGIGSYNHRRWRGSNPLL